MVQREWNVLYQHIVNLLFQVDTKYIAWNRGKIRALGIIPRNLPQAGICSFNPHPSQCLQVTSHITFLFPSYFSSKTSPCWQKCHEKPCPCAVRKYRNYMLDWLSNCLVSIMRKKVGRFSKTRLAVESQSIIVTWADHLTLISLLAYLKDMNNNTYLMELWWDYMK